MSNYDGSPGNPGMGGFKESFEYDFDNPEPDIKYFYPKGPLPDPIIIHGTYKEKGIYKADVSVNGRPQTITFEDLNASR